MSEPAKCPACGATMVETKDENAVVDFCAACGGMWFDKGEIEAEGGQLPDDLTVIPSAQPRTCPRCTTSLGAVRVKDVVIDLCATCGGVYLDRAELDSLIELRKDREADEAREELARTAKEGAQNVGLGVLGLLVDLLGGLF